MKTVSVSLIALLTAMLLTSCEKDVEFHNDNEESGLVLRLAPTTTRVETRSTEPGDDTRNENTINRLNIFIYPHGAAGTVSCLYAQEVTGLSLSGTSVYNQLVNVSRPTFTPNVPYDIYVIANLPQDVSVTANITLSALKALHTQTALNAAVTQSSFVMDGVVTAVINPGTATRTVYADIALHRAVSKIRVKLSFAPGSPVAGGTLASVQLMRYINKGAILDAVPYVVTVADYANTAVVNGNPATTFVFYSYENNWGGNSANEAYLMLNVPNSGHTTNYYRLPVNPYTDLNVDGQNPAGNNTSGRLQRNVLYDVTAYIDKWGSSTQDGAVALTGNYTRTNWTTECGIDVAISNANWLIVSSYQINMKNVASYSLGFSSNIFPVSITNVSVYYNYYKNNGSQVQTSYTSGNPQYPTFSIDQTNRVITINSAIPANYVPKTITFKVTNGTLTSPTITVTQYPPIYVIGKVSSGNLAPDWSNHGSINTLFTVYTTVPSTDGSYILGDPTNGGTKADSTANGIKLLSPQFVICSQWGDSPQLTYAQASYRSTVFAEDIYRNNWRMPTQAEINMINMISDAPSTAVESFFQSAGPYWSAYKYATYNFNSNSWTAASASTTAYIRCVYDSYKYQ